MQAAVSVKWDRPDMRYSSAHQVVGGRKPPARKAKADLRGRATCASLSQKRLLIVSLLRQQAESHVPEGINGSRA